MTKHLLIVLAGLAMTCFSPAAAQSFPNLISPTKVTTVGYWKQHERLVYTVSETSASFKGKSEKPFRESSSGYSIDLVVTDSTDTSYAFEMRYTNPVPDAEADAFTRRISELSVDLPVRYRTDEFGVYDTILNLVELQTELQQKLEASKQILLETRGEEQADIYNMVIDRMAAGFEDLSKVEALFLNDILHLHGCYGFQLQSGQPLDLEVFYPAIIGDYVMRGTGKLTLGLISKAKDECIITLTEKPNRDELNAYMQSMALVFMMDSGKKISFEDLNMTMNSKRKLIMELSSGSMKSVVCTTTVKLTNKKGVQRKVVTRSYNSR